MQDEHIYEYTLGSILSEAEYSLGQQWNEFGARIIEYVLSIFEMVTARRTGVSPRNLCVLLHSVVFIRVVGETEHVFQVCMQLLTTLKNFKNYVFCIH